MSSKEHVLELAKSLAKAQKKGDDSRVLSILESLEDVEMSIALLKATNLGKVVNSITKSVAFKHDADVQSTAKKLVLKWKEMVAAKRVRSNKTKSGKSSQKSSRPQPASEDTSGGVKNESPPSATEHNPVGYLRPEYDWQTGDRTRDKMISKFISVLKPEVDREEYCCFMTVSADIEEELGALYGSNSEQYIAKYRDLHFNLKRNGELRSEILLGHIAPDRLVQMSSEELADKDLKVCSTPSFFLCFFVLCFWSVFQCEYLSEISGSAQVLALQLTACNL